MTTKMCNRCKKEKDINEFRFRNKMKGKRTCWCKECYSIYEKEVWSSSRARRENSNRHCMERKRRNGEFIAKYLSGKRCKDCGEDDIIVLDFHHIGNKEFNISDACMNAYSIEKIEREIVKCEILCANCHRRRTAKEFNFMRYRSLIS